MVETAGTVAYDAAGVASSWTVCIDVADDGVLIWAGEPFVVAHGANVTRRTTIDLGCAVGGCLRETLVLGRTGETGGAVRSTLTARQRGEPAAGGGPRPDRRRTAALPGMLGTARVMDTVCLLGVTAPDAPDLRRVPGSISTGPARWRAR